MTALLSIAEAGHRLGGVGRDTIYGLIADGELETVDIARKGAKDSRTRVLEDSIEAFIERRRSRSGEPTRRRAAAP